MSGSLDTLVLRTTYDVLTASNEVQRPELIALRPVVADSLAHQLMELLPNGPLGASEARHLARLISILQSLPTLPSIVDIKRLQVRYRASTTVLPDSMVPLFEELDRLAKAGNRTGVLGFDSPVRTRGVRPVPEVQPTQVPRPPTEPWIAPDTDTVEFGGTEAHEITVTDPADDGDDPPPPPEPRSFNVAIDDHDASQPLTLGEQYTLAIDVGPKSAVSTGFPEDIFAGTSADLLALTIQLDTADFEVYETTERTLKVPRVGRSQGKARFDLRATRSGRCHLSASIHVAGNFITQLNISVSVGAESGGLEVSAVGRPLDKAVALESRDITLIIHPEGDNYSCTRLGGNGYRTTLPITVGEVTQAADAARAALLQVITTVEEGQYIFQREVSIPTSTAENALQILARAGSRLFQRLFYHSAAGADAKAMGDWLRQYAMAPNLQLTVQILAERLPIPWAMLYFGEVSDGAQLDWNNFLGMRHIVEQLPFQSVPEPVDNRIASGPALTVSLNINPTIDRAMRVDLVEKHLAHWKQIASQRTGLELAVRTMRAEVLAALDDEANRDKLVYFYCHARPSGPGEDPDLAALVMGANNDAANTATLGDLNREVASKTTLTARPLIILNACDSANLSPRFYDGFVPFFLSRGARGVVGTEVKTPALFAVRWAEELVDRLLNGEAIGEAILHVRRYFLETHHNPLALLYAMYCDADTRVAPPLPGASTPPLP